MTSVAYIYIKVWSSFSKMQNFCHVRLECTDWNFPSDRKIILMMSKRSSSHILLVRQQSFIPNYFSPSEFQTTQNKSDCDSNLEETPACVDEAESTYYADYYNEEPLDSTLCSSEASIPSLLQFLASYHHIYEIQTTRLRSSALANLFSCNVSKMTSESKAKLDCDGYFGCPEEKQLTKDHGKKYSFAFERYFVFTYTFSI